MNYQAFLGLLAFPFLAWLFSENKKVLHLRYWLSAWFLQLVFGITFLKIPWATQSLIYLNQGFSAIQSATDRASQFMFGFLAGAEAPYSIINPSANFVIAFRILPLILVVSALSSVLYTLGVTPKIIQGFSFLLKKALRQLSGSLALGAASSVFLGTIETPLLVKNHLAGMNRSTLFALITCSMATISGSVLLLYAGSLQGVVENPVLHLVTASLISIPAALLISDLMIPQVEFQDDQAQLMRSSETVLESFMSGVQEGLGIVLGVIATIICAFAFVYLTDEILSLIHSDLKILSLVALPLKPLLWLTGIPWSEVDVASNIFSQKIVLNEFVAYLDLKSKSPDLSPSTVLTLTYSLCGFANLASAGIIMGGLSSLVPSRRKEISGLVMKSLISGNLATLMTGAVISILN